MIFKSTIRDVTYDFQIFRSYYTAYIFLYPFSIASKFTKFTNSAFSILIPKFGLSSNHKEDSDYHPTTVKIWTETFSILQSLMPFKRELEPWTNYFLL